LIEQGFSEEDTPRPPARLSIPDGDDTTPIENPWTLLAHNRKVLHGWTLLCRSLAENAGRCYRHLQKDPTIRIPGRCYELKGKHYQGAWAFEIGSGERVYYKIRQSDRSVLVYYAGQHPSKVPYPPED